MAVCFGSQFNFLCQSFLRCKIKFYFYGCYCKPGILSVSKKYGSPMNEWRPRTLLLMIFVFVCFSIFVFAYFCLSECMLDIWQPNERVAAQHVHIFLPTSSFNALARLLFLIYQRAQRYLYFMSLHERISNIKQITKPQICNSRNQRVRRERRIQVFIKKQCDLKEIISEVLMGNVDFQLLDILFGLNFLVFSKKGICI